MKRIAPVLWAAGLSVGLAGCQSAVESDAPGTAPVVNDGDSATGESASPAQALLVTLKVPNMV